MNRKLAIVLMAGAAMLAPGAVFAADDALQMVSIDVEGGGGTLFVTPHGKSVLIDTGNPDRGEHPNSENIEKAARSFGLKKIDYLITTHYHVDHIGGLEGVLKRIPIGTFIDHGENREIRGTQGPGGMIGPDWRTIRPAGAPPPGGRGGPGGPGGPGAPGGRGPAAAAPPADPNAPPPGSTAAGYAHYIELIGKSPHRVVKAGDHLDVDGMHILFVDADGAPLPKPLPGAGERPAACASMQPMDPNGGEENSRSTSSLITYGKTKIAAFGDLTWNSEMKLFCPVDKVGKVDVLLASHHGLQFSNSPAQVESLQPKVVIVGNAIRKGDDPDRIKSYMANPRFQGIWHLHVSAGHDELDGDKNQIANPDADQAKDKAYNLRLRIQKNGNITVINERNGFNKTYKAG
ncbi:MAG: MBL fold metallo-hydrolase [Alphaproteobacteria bacterium]|nr:MBL fold metallo-hydrolase [Alphaproteobacteria bacterium]